MFFAAKEAHERRMRKRAREEAQHREAILQEGRRDGLREGRAEGLRTGRAEGVEEGRRQERERIMRAFWLHGIQMTPEIRRILSGETAPCSCVVHAGESAPLA